MFRQILFWCLARRLLITGILQTSLRNIHSNLCSLLYVNIFSFCFFYSRIVVHHRSVSKVKSDHICSLFRTMIYLRNDRRAMKNHVPLVRLVSTCAPRSVCWGPRCSPGRRPSPRAMHRPLYPARLSRIRT